MIGRLFAPTVLFFIIGAVVYNVEYATAPDHMVRASLPQIGDKPMGRIASINHAVVTSQATILNTFKEVSPK